jgi:hypothetical protein
LHGFDGACGKAKPSSRAVMANAEKVHEEIYNMVDTLMIHAVEQKWFSTFAKIGRMEEMVTSQEICVVSWGGLFCNSCNISN